MLAMPDSETARRGGFRTTVARHAIRGRVLLLIAVLLGSSIVVGEQDDPSGPKRTDVVEREGTRLVQIEVNLRGPADTLDSLTRDDFALTVGGSAVEEFEVDKLCRDPAHSRSLDRVNGEIAAPAGESPVLALGPTTFLFYFDQQHLTMGGRQESIDILERMIPALVTNGNRASLVSNGRNLETLVETTTDPGVLLAALREMQGDFDHFDGDAQLEDNRVSEVLALTLVDYHRAVTMAREYYGLELWRAERNLRRLSMTLGRLATVARPKVVIYFADNMRRAAGKHYFDLFGAAKRSLPEYTGIEAGSAAFSAQLPFDRVIDEAAAQGVRLYPIEGQGLEAAASVMQGMWRFREAEGTLASLALETGGEAFLNGVPTPRILEKLEQDLSCLYLISFPPEGLREDVAQRVVVKVDRPKVKVQSRGRVIIQSETERRVSRLMAAFATRSADESEIDIRPTVVPTGFVDGKFTALVQVAVPRSELPGSTWDLGFSAISRGKVRDASGRLTVNHPGAAVVLQESMIFPAGPFEIVAVAHNATVDSIASSKLEGSWPKPRSELASLGPIAVVQPGNAAILRDDQIRTSGHAAFAEEEPVLADRPLTLVALVCRSPDASKKLVVERQLAGAESVRFDPMEVELGKDACAVIHDNVRAGTMTPGAFYYRIQVRDDDEELTRGERRFFVWDGKPFEVSASREP
jgi:VWFA-related protein